MDNFILIAVIAAIISLAALYIYRSKKKGQHCIGCPSGGCCQGGCAGCSGCGKA